MCAKSWHEYGFVLASAYRVKVLSLLSEKPYTPTQICTKLRLNMPHVSRTLSELTNKKLVVCLNPDAVKGRIFALTDKGKEVSDMLPKDVNA